MKLNKENFTKTIDGDIVRYSYNCNDTDFYVELVGQNKNRNINVFSGSLDDRQNLLTTTSSLEAWNHFEDLLKVCNTEQGSSGGGNLGNNPQQNPNILPLLAIDSTSGGMTQITLFAQMDDKSQTKIFDFEVDSNTLPNPLPTNVFTVDWSAEDITQLLKGEVLLKEFDSITFEENPNSKVFVFIPKSIANQGGEEGGNTQKGEDGDGEPVEEGEDGQPQKDKGDKKRTSKDQKAKPSDEPGDEGEPTDETGDEGGEPTDKKGKGQPTDEPGEPTDEPNDEKPQKGDKGENEEKGEPTDEPGENDGESKPNEDEDEENSKTNGGKNELKPINFSDTIQELADSTDGEYNPSELLSIFRNTETGEVWLSSNNFPKIKKDLNLPQSMTPRQFSQQIINSK